MLCNASPPRVIRAWEGLMQTRPNDSAGSLARGRTDEVTIHPVNRGVAFVLEGGPHVRSWTGGVSEIRGEGTAFVLALDAATLDLAHGTYPLPASSYAVVPGWGRLTGGAGVVVVAQHHCGLLHVGGAAEPRGRLRYIDGCTDTLLVAPIVHGDPCLNLLHVPPDTVQSDHHHPSARVGLVVEGEGSCVAANGRHRLERGSVFVVPRDTTHRFETGGGSGLLLMAWHPDSTSGPTDADHPMLNRTLGVAGATGPG
jgi:quercetin dioxygenase-like cupin family protein